MIIWEDKKHQCRIEWDGECYRYKSFPLGPGTPVDYIWFMGLTNILDIQPHLLPVIRRLVEDK